MSTTAPQTPGKKARSDYAVTIETRAGALGGWRSTILDSSKRAVGLVEAKQHSACVDRAIELAAQLGLDVVRVSP